MPPEQAPHALLIGKVNEVADHVIRPTVCVAFQDVVTGVDLPGHLREPLHVLDRARPTAVDILPHARARRDPGRVHPLGEQLRVGRLAQVRQDVAVDQRIQIGAHHYHPPRRRDRAHHRRGHGLPLGFVATVAQLVGVIDRLAVPQADLEATTPVALQCHTRVIDQIGLGDRGEAGAIGQLDCHRWPDPLSGLHIADIVAPVPRLVVSFQVVVPDDGPGG